MNRMLDLLGDNPLGRCVSFLVEREDKEETYLRFRHRMAGPVHCFLRDGLCVQWERKILFFSG